MTAQPSTAWGKLEIENIKGSDYTHLVPVPLRGPCQLPKTGRTSNEAARWTDKTDGHEGSPLTANSLTAHPSHFLPPTHTQHSLPRQHKHGETENWALVGRSLILWYFLGDDNFTGSSCEAQQGLDRCKETENFLCSVGIIQLMVSLQLESITLQEE